MSAVRVLVAEGHSVDEADEDGRTPLFIACREGNVDCARHLIEARAATVNQARKDGVTPLLIACSQDKPACVQLLLESSAAVDKAAEDMATPLIISCQEGTAECAAQCEAAHGGFESPAVTLGLDCKSEAVCCCGMNTSVCLKRHGPLL